MKTKTIILKNILKKIYKIFCWVYRNIVSILQSFFLKDSKKNIKNIFFTLQLKNNYYKNIIKKSLKELNLEYQIIYLMDKNAIYKLLKNLFNKELRDKITKKTGYKYSIDYCIIYKNYPIPKSESNRSIYANHFHVDKPYSRNMLKIILPISVKDKDFGPIIVKRNKPLVKSLTENNTEDFSYFCSNENNTLIYGFYPSRCLHKALSPSEDNQCHQIMVQLNPSRNWKINQKIYRRQAHKEPKFTEFINLFDKFSKI